MTGVDGSVYRLTQTHKLPSHSSKMVLSIVKIGPPRLTKSRTFQLTLVLDF